MNQKLNSWFGIIILFLFVSCNQDGKKSDQDSDPTRVGIQPFGNVPQEQVDSVKVAIERMFDFEVVVLDRVELPANAYTEIRYPRYRADTLVEWLANHKPDDVDKIFGLTNNDISITKYKEGTNKGEIKEPEWQYKDFGIFGLGRLGGTSCIVSSNRLHKDVSDEKFFMRLMRISCHEIGHTLWLPHCPNLQCLMNDANESIKTVDKSSGELCEDCKKRID